MPFLTDRYACTTTETLCDPYPVRVEPRRSEIVFRHEGRNSWVLPRYADCARVLRDHATLARVLRRPGDTVLKLSLNVQNPASLVALGVVR